MAIQGQWSFGSRFNPRSRQSTYIYDKGSDDERYVSLPKMMAALARKDLVGFKKGKATSKDLSPKVREEIAALQKEYDGLKAKGISFRSVMTNKQEAREKWEASPGYEKEYNVSRNNYNTSYKRYKPAPVKSGTDLPDDEPMRAGNFKAQAAPPKGALARSAAQNTTTVATPKETVSRKAVSHVSARMKQKTANRSAGIRT